MRFQLSSRYFHLSSPILASNTSRKYVQHVEYLQALVELGEDKKIGEELVPLIAGNGENYNYEGLTPYMAPLQIQVYLLTRYL